MSRSTKKPYYTDQQKGDAKAKKRIANKAIRLLDKDEAPAKGKQYRKYSESWDIRDWSFKSKDKKATRK